MNKFPYNAGHLMVVPKAHKGKLAQLTSAESNEMFELTRRSVEILEQVMPTAGFNIGLNIGSDAGARWSVRGTGEASRAPGAVEERVTRASPDPLGRRPTTSPHRPDVPQAASHLGPDRGSGPAV